MNHILIQASQLILSLSILIVLHELGHFIPARLFKIRVEKFYLFFDPWFSLFKVKKGGTEYGIGWLPLGGYVKIAGMIDESMDKEQMAKPAEPWEFRSKPAWQRLIVMIGGVTVNIIVGFLIYMMMMGVWGDTYLPVKNMKYGVVVDSTAMALGFKDGDKILAVEGKEIEKFEKVTGTILMEGARNVTVEREGQKKTIVLPQGYDQMVIKNKSRLFEPAFPFVVDSVIPNMAAAKAGLKVGDKIVRMNGDTLRSYFQFNRQMVGAKNKELQISVLRNGEIVDLTMKSDENGKIGVAPVPPAEFINFTTRDYSFFEAIPAGIQKGKETLTGYVQQFKLVFTKEGAKQIGGFGTFGSLFPPVWDWQSFWGLTAFISIILAFMNILPIPALDGGHVMFLLYEMITGRKPHEKVMEYAQYAGMLLLLALLLYANGNDIFRAFNK